MMIASKKELQIEVDDVYSCSGSCPGCMLTMEERMGRKPDMSEATMDLTLAKVADYITGLQSSDGIDSINLTFGIGDHLRMPDEYLELITRKTERFFEETPGMPESRAMHVTMSLIGQHHKVERSLRILKAHRSVDVIPIVVIDPILLFSERRFAPEYLKNIERAVELFDQVDMQINISDKVVEEISSEEVFIFTRNKGFSEVTINWVPNKINQPKTTTSLQRTSEWLLELASLIDQEEGLTSSFIPVVEKCLNAQKKSEKLEIFEFIERITEETYKYSIQIDEKGNIFPKMEAVGDVPFNARFGFPTIGNVKEDTIEEAVIKGTREIAKWLKKAMMKAPCLECEHQKACCAGGYQAYNKVITHKNECRNPAYGLFEAAVSV